MPGETRPPKEEDGARPNSPAGTVTLLGPGPLRPQGFRSGLGLSFFPNPDSEESWLASTWATESNSRAWIGDLDGLQGRKAALEGKTPYVQPQVSASLRCFLWCNKVFFVVRVSPRRQLK
jgi:hypothetical protein